MIIETINKIGGLCDEMQVRKKQKSPKVDFRNTFRNAKNSIPGNTAGIPHKKHMALLPLRQWKS